MLSKWRALTVVTLDEKGNAITDFKNPEQDANQEWEISAASEAVASSATPKGMEIYLDDITLATQCIFCTLDRNLFHKEQGEWKIPEIEKGQFSFCFRVLRNHRYIYLGTAG